MDIRPATPDDVPAVLPMVRKVCAFHESLDPAKYGFRKDPARMYDQWLVGRSTDPRSVFLVADRSAGGTKAPALAGFLVGTVEREIPIYRLKEFGFIHDLWVEEKYRNEGIARQMVTLAIERFREIGVKQVRLDTAAANEPARNLFLACGFRPSIIEMLTEL
jgi:ribosomal protein S18 acetylase RimI-like enzyme